MWVCGLPSFLPLLHIACKFSRKFIFYSLQAAGGSIILRRRNRGQVED